MKRLLTLTLALLMALSLFAIGGKNYARAEEAASKYVGLWEITGCEEDGTFISSTEAGQRIYMSFLPSGIIYAVNLHGSEWEEAYYAYRANGEDALYIFEGDEPLPCAYDPETDIITVSDPNSTMKLFLQRVKDDPLPDIHTLVQHTEVDREYSGYMLRMGEQTIDLVEHLAITEEEADEYYYLKLRSDGTGYVQFGSEKMSGNIRWNETTFFAEDDDDPAPYTREGDHILMDLNGTVVEFAPIKEVEALVGVKIWELNNTAVQLPEELIGTWELAKCTVQGMEFDPDQLDMDTTIIVNKNGTAAMYTKGAAPMGYRLTIKDESTLRLVALGVEMYTLKYDGTVLTLTMMGMDLIFEKDD